MQLGQILVTAIAETAPGALWLALPIAVRVALGLVLAERKVPTYVSAIAGGASAVCVVVSLVAVVRLWGSLLLNAVLTHDDMRTWTYAVYPEILMMFLFVFMAHRAVSLLDHDDSDEGSGTTELD